MNKYYIAVDAGGTKTLAYLANSHLEILKQGKSGSGNPGLNQETAFENIFSAINQVFDENIKIECISLGISGYGTLKNKDEFKILMEKKYHTKVILNNDGVIALHSVLKNEVNGIMVLCGTGSVILASSLKGIYQIGGFGHLLIEKGSAYTCVVDILRQIIMENEESDLSSFSHEVLKRFELKDVESIKKLIYHSTKDQVASKSKIISEMSLEYVQAKDYLKNIGKDLALEVIKAYKKIDMCPFILGFRGSFINNCHFVKESLLHELNKQKINFEVEDQAEEPIYGALYIAMKGLN